ncbi:Molybdopterin-guanine dinucleotide biosynthesis adapter protein [Methylobacterium bullatum]|uniref:Molybdopterin-guanine dinucleotide biosynthesis adapter protein n=1 Tax=Methylobacterium bullatum TaxID=570505 RepID=A0A679J9P9_9HYPH|nr:Molybdopterin-guanine dinucleotide biosynthesis adapter protein [Methylobacterium bullatum]
MTKHAMRVMGLAGWSGAGKTTLLAKLIPALIARGLTVSTIKHAHHAFDVDQPGKDSYRHRQAGASEVLISSALRWVQMHEVRDGEEASLAELLRRLSPCDLVLVEGFKREGHPKIEIHRNANGRPPLHPQDENIVAIASDQVFPDAGIPVVDLDDVAAIADLVASLAEPVDAILNRIEGHGAAD